MNDELLDFIHQLSTWHSNRVAHLRTIQDGVKEGTKLRVQSVMTLDQEEIDIARTVSRAVRYLVARGLLAGHPTSQRVVRPLVVLKDA